MYLEMKSASKERKIKSWAIPEELMDVPFPSWNIMQFDLMEGKSVYKFMTESDARAFISAVENLIEYYKIPAKAAFETVEKIGSIRM